MDVRTVWTTVGAAIATSLVVAVVVIEALAVEFSAIVGLPLGLLAGAAAGGAVLAAGESLGPTAGRALEAVAAFGYAAVALLAISYANLAGLRSAITPERVVALAVLAAILAFLASWFGPGGSRQTR